MNKAIKVASVQMEHINGNKVKNLKKVEYYTRKAADEGAHIVVFPECCITGYWFLRKLPRQRLVDLAEQIPEGETPKYIMELSQLYNIIIGVGLIEIDNEGKLYNSYYVAMPDGTYGNHRKIHTFISEHMESGSEYTVFDTPFGCRVGVLTCYDSNINENVRINALMGAQIILAPHQTGGCDSPDPKTMGLVDKNLWRNRHNDPEAIESELKGMKGRGWLMRWLPTRAHDNGVFIIFSNGIGEDDDEIRTGNAMIIDPYGDILAETWKAGDDMVVSQLDFDLIEISTGKWWIKTRRPELYGPLSTPTGLEEDTRKVRFEKR